MRSPPSPQYISVKKKKGSGHPFFFFTNTDAIIGACTNPSAITTCTYRSYLYIYYTVYKYIKNLGADTEVGPHSW